MSQAPDTPPTQRQQALEAHRPTVDDALALARVGLPIVPLKPSTKEPRFRDWQKLYNTDPTVIAGWWRQCPGANIGYVIPRGVLVIDVDPRNGGLVGWKNLLAQHGDLPTTRRVWTGRQDGGFHLYFTVAADVEIPDATDIDMGVQALGHRHLVVLPPSLHPDTGQAYAWDAAHNLFTMPTPAPAPDWLRALTLETAQRHAPKKKLGDARATSEASSCATPSGERDGEGATTRMGKETGSPSTESTKVPQDVTPPPGTLVDGPGKHLRALACDPKNLPALLKACGLPSTLDVGHTTRCPFHDDAHPSASLLGPNAEKKRRSYGLYCHASACKRYYSLLDIFKARESAGLLSIHTELDSTGQPHDHSVLYLQWLTHMLEKAGIIHLYELGAPSLPPNASEVEKAVWSIALHTRRLRAATRKASEAFALSWRYVKDCLGRACEWTQYQIQQAKCRLIARGSLERDHVDAKTGITYWRIGSKALRRAMRDTPVLPTERANVESVEATPVIEPVVHTGHAWSAVAPSTVRSCPLAADDPDHDETACVLWQAWLKTEAKKRLYGSPPLVELPPVDWEAFYAP
jgi:hypothetical protein